MICIKILLALDGDHKEVCRLSLQEFLQVQQDTSGKLTKPSLLTNTDRLAAICICVHFITVTSVFVDTNLCNPEARSLRKVILLILWTRGLLVVHKMGDTIMSISEPPLRVLLPFASAYYVLLAYVSLYSTDSGVDFRVFTGILLLAASLTSATFWYIGPRVSLWYEFRLQLLVLGLFFWSEMSWFLPHEIHMLVLGVLALLCAISLILQPVIPLFFRVAELIARHELGSLLAAAMMSIYVPMILSWHTEGPLEAGKFVLAASLATVALFAIRRVYRQPEIQEGMACTVLTLMLCYLFYWGEFPIELDQIGGGSQPAETSSLLSWVYTLKLRALDTAEYWLVPAWGLVVILGIYFVWLVAELNRQMVIRHEH